MTDQEFATLIASGYETRGVEFKGPGKRTEKHFLAKVARAVLGMANRRDGSHVVIGVEDNRGTLIPKGLTDQEADTWKNYDDIASSINNYASPSVSFDRQQLDYEGRPFIILRVDEFEDIPILCCIDYQAIDKKGKNVQILRKGAGLR